MLTKGEGIVKPPGGLWYNATAHSAEASPEVAHSDVSLSSLEFASFKEALFMWYNLLSMLGVPLFPVPQTLD